MITKEVIYVADDFGMSPEINDAIVHSHTSGRLQAAALMMGQPGTQDAIALARMHPGLQIGWHLHLTDSQPATTERWPWGASPARAGWSIGLLASARALMRREVHRQWNLFQATGLECRFINSHHHLHAHPFIYRTLHEVIGPRFAGWIRLGRPRFFHRRAPSEILFVAGDLVQARRRRLSPWRATDTLWGLDRLFHMKATEVHDAIDSLPAGFHEFLFHPRHRSCPDTQCLLELNS